MAIGRADDEVHFLQDAVFVRLIVMGQGSSRGFDAADAFAGFFRRQPPDGFGADSLAAGYFSPN